MKARSNRLSQKSEERRPARVRVDVLTLFPEFFDSPLRASMLGRAIASGVIDVRPRQIRDWTTDKHRMTDDTPYGGGGGMVMKAESVTAAVRAVREEVAAEMASRTNSGLDSGSASSAGAAPAPAPFRPPVIYMSPQGEPLTARLVDELAALPAMILLCGSYEGIDERAVEKVVDREISIGDYVLTGGEVAALVVTNAVFRKLPGALGNESSHERDSFENGLLDFPHYTRPEIFEGLGVPEVLMTGHHAKVEEWRRQMSLVRTARRRPDLLARAPLTEADRAFLRAQGFTPPGSPGSPSGALFQASPGAVPRPPVERRPAKE